MSSTHHAKRLYVGTTAERTALSLTTDGRGIVWYDTGEDRAYIWSGSAWIEATKVSELWQSDGGGIALQADAAGGITLSGAGATVVGSAGNKPDLGAAGERWGSIFVASGEEIDGAGTLAINAATSLTINDDGADSDTIIEGDTDTALFYIDAGNDRVGISTNAPQTQFHVLASGIAGTPAALSRHTIFLQNSSAAGTLSAMAIVAGNTGQSSVDFGDTDDVDVGRIVYRHNDDQFRINANATNIMFIQGDGNIGINDNDYGSGEGVINIKDAATNPSADPAGGGILYSDGGAGKWRSSGGTTTTFGPAEPHCPVCGRDTVLEWENKIQGWHLIICITCLTNELGERPWIIKS